MAHGLISLPELHLRRLELPFESSNRAKGRNTRTMTAVDDDRGRRKERSRGPHVGHGTILRRRRHHHRRSLSPDGPPGAKKERDHTTGRSRPGGAVIRNKGRGAVHRGVTQIQE